MEKRIYSLNLIAFIMMETGLQPSINQDEKGMFYGVFPEIRGVAYAIKKWKSAKCEVEIHRFLNCYKELRDTIKEIRFPELNKEGH